MKPTREFFDQQAGTWEDKSYPPEIRKRVSELVGQFHIEKGAWVMDLGTGTGILHPYLSMAVGAAGRVFAFDLSFQMVREAKKKPHGPNLLCIQASAMHIPLPDKVCDLVICFAAFPHFADKLKALQEMARVAKREANVVIAHLMSSTEIKKHHGSHSSVAGDELPDRLEMRRIFLEAGLSDPEIRDEPGKFLARALKI